MAPGSNQLQYRSFIQTIIPLSKTLQFYWFIGHVLSFYFFLLTTIFSFFSRRKSLYYYQLTLVFVIITYSIVIKQIYLKNTSFTALRKKLTINLLKDENVQYLLLAVTLLVSSFKIGSISGGLYSFEIFSIFHILSYFQNYLLNSLPLSLSTQQSINSKINFFTSNYNQQALYVAANSELFLPIGFFLQIPSLLFTLFRDPVYVVVYIQVFIMVVVFVKLRYNDNKFSQSIVAQWDAKVQQIVNHPQLQTYQLGQLYNGTIKGLLNSYLGPIRIAPVSAKKSQ